MMVAQCHGARVAGAQVSLPHPIKITCGHVAAFANAFALVISTGIRL